MLHFRIHPVLLILFSALLSIISGNLFSQGIDQSKIAGQKQLLERILMENILPFWHPQMIDVEYGGYRLNHDIRGQWLGPAPKALVTQSRTVWFFSKLVNSGYPRPEFLEAAAHGYRFLRDKMWDRDHGGFYWEVDHTGRTATRPNKHLYALSFALYALSEYSMASGSDEALDLANRLFQLLETHAHDVEYGGYREYFRRDWQQPPQDEVGYMNVVPALKLMNTHLHLMEAMTTYFLASRNPTARERLLELITIESNAVVRKSLGACTDKYRRDWTPLRGSQFERVSFGHDIENVWLLIEACEAAGLANGPLVDLYRSLTDYSLRYGFDWQEGGFYDSGPFNAPADRRSKIWWVQAEGLVGALALFQLTGETRYYEVFTKTLQWIAGRQTDWESGDWFATVTQEGEATGSKAGAWKSPYHNGRAVLTALKLLSGSPGG